MPSSSLLPKHGLHLLHPKSTYPKPWKPPHLPPPPPPTYHPLPPQQHTLSQSWTSLISSIKHDATQLHLSPAFAAYSTLRHHSPPPHLLPFPISSLFLCSATLRSVPQGRQLHAHALSLGLLPSDPSLSAKLVSLYASSDLFDSARAAAEDNAGGLALPWNVLISAYVKVSLFRSALLAYDGMVERGVEGDAFTYPTVLKACGELQDLDLGRGIHESVIRDQLGKNLFVQNALVSMYARCGEMKIARDLFDDMPERDGVSWNAMISGYASRQMWSEAFGLFEVMVGAETERVEVNTVTWNTVAGGYLDMGNYTEALRLVAQIRTSGSAVDHVTFVIGLRACSQIDCVNVGREIHGVAMRTNCDEIETVRNALITMYSRCKDLRCAYDLFRTAEARSVVTWNCMITGYCILDKPEEASSIFRDMVLSGIHPNYVTVVTILSLFGRVANLQHGRELHNYITKHNFEEHRLLWNSLIDMYSKSGRIKEARRVFDFMKDRDEVSYTSLIAGYGMQGEGHLALELFNEMTKQGIKADHVTMVTVLSACSHAGLVEQGQALFDQMVDLYGIAPLMEHYSCMVDLFGRAGQLQRAEEFLENSPQAPTASMWASLVGACHVYRNTEIGERAATKLLSLRPDNPGHYVLIANMYAAAGCWEELAKVRVLMRDMGIKKVPGCASVDTRKGYHHFLVGDKDIPDSDEIYMLLEGLGEHLKDAGYVANEYLEFDDETDVQCMVPINDHMEFDEETDVHVLDRR